MIRMVAPTSLAVTVCSTPSWKAWRTARRISLRST